MGNEFAYDVFLSQSAKDKAVVRPLAERLRKDRLKMGFDEWVLKSGDSIPANIGEGLQHFQSGFQPSPAAPIKGSLTQFLNINWRPTIP
jgi:hypothetical protein